MEFYQAIKDCESAIKIDPKTLKAYQRKANCHFITKEYHKVLQTIDDGLKLFPDDQELKQLREKTIMAINMGTGDDDLERQKKAASDPEIQALLRDPRIQQLFKDFKEIKDHCDNLFKGIEKITAEQEEYCKKNNIELKPKIHKSEYILIQKSNLETK